MLKILIPFDGSENSLRAVQYAAKTSQKNPSLEFDLLHVFDPVPVRAHAALTQDEIRLLHAEDTNLLFEPAQRILDHASSKYTTHYRFGNPASEIAAHVIEKGCDAVIMGTRGHGLIGGAVIGSVGTRVVHLVGVPVTLIK